MKRATAAALVLTPLSACVSVSHAVLADRSAHPVPPREVAFFLFGGHVPWDCDPVALLSAHGSRNFADEGDLLDGLREEAGELGANAVYLQFMSEDPRNPVQLPPPSDPAYDAAVLANLIGAGRGAKAIALHCPRHGGDPSPRRDRALAYGEPRGGRIGTGADNFAEIWTVRGTAGRTIGISAKSDDFDVLVELFSPSGELIARDDDGGLGLDSELVTTLEASGRFRVRVREADFGEPEGGDYAIAVRDQSIDRIRMGSNSVGTIDPGGYDVGLWTFDGSARDVVVVGATSSEMDPVVDLYSPTGAWLGTDDDSGPGLGALLVERLEAPGRYQVRVHDFDEGGGRYEIVADRVAELLPSASAVGDLSEGGLWAFEGERGEAAVVDVASTTFDPTVTLLSGSDVDFDAPIGYDGGGGLDSRVEAALPESGWYLVVVDDYGGGTAGDYRIALATFGRYDASTPAGSGFHVSRSGHVLTNAHVIERCREVRVLPGGAARIVARDDASDLALLKVDATAPPAPFRQGRGVRPGTDLVVVGFPLQRIFDASDLAVTTGVVSRLAGPDNDRRLFQMTAALNPGNSGGPVLDGAGRVVGVATAALDPSVAQNVNFAVSAGTARAFLDAEGIAYETAPSDIVPETEVVATRARTFTVRIECGR